MSQSSLPKPVATSKIFLVDRGYQFKIALLGAGIGLLSSLFGLAVVWYPLHLFERLPVGMTLPPEIYGMIALAVLANVAAIVSYGVRISHRVAGPVYSIVRHMRAVEKGEKVKLLRARQNDELKYLVRNYNNLLVGLELSRRQRLAQLTDAHQALTALLTKQAGLNPQLQAELAKLEALKASLSKAGLETLPEETLRREAKRAEHAKKAQDQEPDPPRRAS